MAGVTSHNALAPKVRLINPAHHQNHLARNLLFLGVVGIPGPIATGFLGMAIDTVHVQGGGKKSHSLQELVHRNAAKQLHVFEDLFGHLRLLLWFTLRQGNSEQRHKRSRHQARDRALYSPPHSAFHLCQCGIKKMQHYYITRIILRSILSRDPAARWLDGGPAAKRTALFVLALVLKISLEPQLVGSRVNRFAQLPAVIQLEYQLSLPRLAIYQRIVDREIVY